MFSLITAQTYKKIGIATIPLGIRSKRPDTGIIGDGWRKYQSQLPTDDELKKWFYNGLRNIAIVTGWNNLVIVDFDNLALYGVWKSIYPHLDKTYKVETRRGYHAYFYIKNPPLTGLKWEGIDVKAAGGYCLIPPSIHPTGHVYTPIQGPIQTVDHLSDVLPKSLLDKTPDINPAAFSQPRPFTPFDQLRPSDWIKRNVNIIDYFPSARRTSRDHWFAVRCPFHDDNRESGWINATINRYGCHSCINGSMDVIQFYCQLKGVDFTQAVRELK